MRNILKTILMMGVALTFLGDDCSGEMVTDGSFRLWRNDRELAAWKVEAGGIQKVGTWDESDPGVLFEGPRTVLSQSIKDGSSCAEVTIMGYVDANASLTISGGTNAMVAPPLSWTTYKDLIGIAYAVDQYGRTVTALSSKISITRTGEGKVILGTIQVKSASGCRDDAVAKPVVVHVDAGYSAEF